MGNLCNVYLRNWKPRKENEGNQNTSTTEDIGLMLTK